VSPEVCAPLRVRCRAAVALCLTVLVATGCGESSRVDPNAKVTITGAVRTPTGAPLAGRGVRLGAGVPDDDATLAVLTAGLACADGLCRGTVLETTTTTAGTFTFTLKGKDTQGSFGKVKSELVSVSAAPIGNQVSGASASARFVVQTEKVPLPLLQLVDPRLSVQAQGPSVVSRWVKTSPGPYVLSFETGSPVPAWEVTTAAAVSGLDGRLLEGTSGRVVLVGGSQDSIEGSAVGLRWRSPGVAFASATGAPASRGARCVFARAGRTMPAASCGVTDGELASGVTPPMICDAATKGQTSPPSCSVATTVTVLLATPVPADLVAVRGCSGSCPVEVSADARGFRAVGTAATEDAAVRLDGQRIRAVRVGLSASGLREVSVWEPQRRPVLTPVGPQALGRLRVPYFPTTRSVRSHLLLYSLAGGLVLLLVVGLAFQLGRRRPQIRPSGG
jgi:hypothetical protein